MQKLHILLVLATIFSAQTLLAADDSALGSKPCGVVADACIKGGFSRDESSGKKFWADCMKPVLLNQTVQNVTVDPATAKECRMNKVSELKKELQEFEGVSSN